MNDIVFECLRSAVNLAKEGRSPKVETLRMRLAHVGYDAQTIDEALKFWAEYEASKGNAPSCE